MILSQLMKLKMINTFHKIALGLVCTLLTYASRAQYFEYNWSDDIKYTNGRDGFFSGYINTNGTYMYVLHSNYAATPINRFNKVKLVAYNKFTMTESATVALKGFPENKGAKEQFEELRYFKTVVLDDGVIVFWTKLLNTDSTKTEELYAETLKADLERENALKKVYSVTQKVDVHQSEFALPSIVVAANSETGELVIGSELHRPGKNVVLNYMTTDSGLNGSAERQIEFPALCGETQNGLISGYELGRDGNLYIRSTVALSREEIRLLKPTDATSYLVLTVLDPVAREKAVVEMRGESKTITDFSYVITDSTARVLGFFGDLSKDPSGIDKQGIFYADLESDALKNTALTYSYFEKTSLNKLFPKSKGGRRKTDVPSPEEQLQTRFDIESLYPMEDGSVVLFFTRKYNYAEITSRSGMDGKNIYKTDYYCEKNNVSAIRFSAAGKVLWTSNIERTKTYEGTDVSDVRVIQRLNKFYVMYGTEPSKTVKKRRKFVDLRDELEYATFDPATGKAKKQELKINEGVSLKDKKMIDPNSIRAFDNRFYHSRMVVKQKPEWYAVNVLFFPSIYYSALSGNTKYAKGELGVISLMDGKPEKKRR